MVVLGNGGFLVVSLLKALFGDWTLQGENSVSNHAVKTTILFVHHYLPEGVVLGNLFWSLGVITTSGATAVSPCMFWQVFLFYFSF
jgi:hypothetical protein